MVRNGQRDPKVVRRVESESESERGAKMLVCSFGVCKKRAIKAQRKRREKGAHDLRQYVSDKRAGVTSVAEVRVLIECQPVHLYKIVK